MRLAATREDVAAAQALRARLFLGGGDGRDQDAFDDHFSHVLVETSDKRLVATLRFQHLKSKKALNTSYSAQFYDLEPLADLLPAVEVGRFCMDPALGDAQALRLVMGVMTQEVMREKAAMMFGCSSFAGCDPKVSAPIFAAFEPQHVGPLSRQPRATASACFDLSQVARGAESGQIPGLLGGYLAMGGWVCGTGVIDQTLGTHHLLTVVEVAKVPPARRRVFEALAVSLSNGSSTTP